MSETRPPVFDDHPRTDATPADHRETSFQFLNRVAGSYWDQVRELVQDWLNHIIDDVHYRDIRGRLRADNASSYSAFLELYVHELLLRAGYQVVIHPDVPSSSRHPDFLAEGHGEAFYVEATMPGPPSEALGAAQRRAVFLDTIQQIRNQDFFLALEHLVVGPYPAKGRKARRQVERWLATLDPDEVTYDRDSRSRFRWALDGWEVEFSSIPIPAENRGRPNHRIIGIYADTDAHFEDDAPTIRSALAGKATAYGALDKPLIIAIGTYIWDTDRWHSANALYGTSALTWVAGEDVSAEPIPTRMPDGFFGTVGQWSNRGVGAILHINQLQPHHVQRAEATLWFHPAGSGALNSLAGRIPATAMLPSSGTVHEIPPEVHPNTYFDLPDPWPIGDAFPDN
ncbi:hypothetical protein BKG69_12520 [Mycobacteroides chelonae]|uniref:hypothetical protein n=1 Tax=Mycobacteroides chelonae TaxID=1774 RepID=UPI0008A8F9AA|nr:hypothetical protein [Mycobacteroides chelonae]OHT79227.1 hypothetical protein BKG69_12520 [Mycobacteroides chelonae]